MIDDGYRGTEKVLEGSSRVGTRLDHGNGHIGLRSI